MILSCRAGSTSALHGSLMPSAGTPGMSPLPPLYPHALPSMGMDPLLSSAHPSLAFGAPSHPAAVAAAAAGLQAEGKMPYGLPMHSDLVHSVFEAPQKQMHVDLVHRQQAMLKQQGLGAKAAKQESSGEEDALALAGQGGGEGRQGSKSRRRESEDAKGNTDLSADLRQKNPVKMEPLALADVDMLSSAAGAASPSGPLFDDSHASIRTARTTGAETDIRQNDRQANGRPMGSRGAGGAADVASSATAAHQGGSPRAVPALSEGDYAMESDGWIHHSMGQPNHPMAQPMQGELLILEASLADSTSRVKW